MGKETLKDIDLAGMNILVVDDTPGNLSILEKLLSSEGFNISVAPSGEVALELASCSHPDLILMDVMMPGIDGFETCRRLKSDEATQDIPVIFVTAKNEIDSMVEGFSVGGVDYIQKPFHQAEVLARVKNQLKLVNLMRKYQELSITDPLTGLVNRRGMKDKMEYERNRSERSKVVPALIIADIDHFKKVNDEYGHDAGDQVLVRVAEVFSKSSRKQDVVCRWGGEEFLLLLPETNQEGALSFAEKLREGVELLKIKTGENEIAVTVSLGVSIYEGSGDMEACIKKADECLYEAKETGRNRVVV